MEFDQSQDQKDTGRWLYIVEVNIQELQGDRFSSLYCNSYLSVELQLS